MSISRWEYVDDNTSGGSWGDVPRNTPKRRGAPSSAQEQWDTLQEWLQSRSLARAESVKEKPLQQQLEEHDMHVNLLKSLVQKLDQVADLDEVVMGLAQAKSLKGAYTETGIPVPEWISEAVETLAGEVKRRTQDELKRQEKALVQELEALKSREEKKAEKERRLAELRDRLKA